MKEIKTNNFKKKQADLIEHPPIATETEDVSSPEKMKQYSYRLRKWVWVDKI